MHRCVAFHDDGDAERGDLFADGVGDLVRQPLLHLQAPAEDVDEPRNLAQADHLGARNVGDVALAEKRQQVVLAETVEVDVLDDDHLAVVDCEQRVVEHLCRCRLRIRWSGTSEPVSTRLGVLTSPSRAGSSPSSASSVLIRSCIAHCISRHALGPGFGAQTQSADALYADRDNLASARQRGRSLDAQRSPANPRDFDSRVEAGTRRLLARRTRAPIRAARFLRAGHRGRTKRRSRSSRTGRRDISGSRPTWARSRNRAGLGAGLKYRKPIKTRARDRPAAGSGILAGLGRSRAGPLVLQGAAPVRRQPQAG